MLSFNIYLSQSHSVLSTVASLTFAFAEAFVCLGFTYAQLGVLLFGGDIPKKGFIQEMDGESVGRVGGGS